MGRNVRDKDILSTPPFRMSPRSANAEYNGQAFSIGRSLTATVTVVEVTGQGIVDSLVILQGIGNNSATNTLFVYLDIDSVRALSCTYTLTAGTGNCDVVGFQGAGGIPFNQSFKMSVKSSGQETSISYRGSIIYRIL